MALDAADISPGGQDETVHHISARAKRSRPKPKMQPPLTPMIDVTFQLLIYFILTAQFHMAEGQIPGSLPRDVPSPPGQTPLEPIRIRLLPAGPNRRDVRYEIRGENLALTDATALFDRLMARKQVVDEEVPVIIHPARNVRWEWVVEAFNQAVRAEFKSITIDAGG